jgi:hypothetical protein
VIPGGRVLSGNGHVTGISVLTAIEDDPVESDAVIVSVIF